ncbi:BPL-N domain-containing protein [Pseudomonas fluorescens]|uniref:BPL-N domain-containing protein n=1 Tax=Pseudomonas fluorescens TaxID=294 RepID=UPI0021D2B9F8|nr:BPL-N domain-containing protein [Pseudomonas fluorescens]UXV17965.1 BPL-N domain-containing protein [Pseudomonas fluorescens]
MHLPATAAVLLAFATLQAPFVHAATPITHVAIYRGPAGCDDCSESVKRALQRLSPTYQIDFVGADESVDITPHNLARYDLYVQPGGGQDIPAALDSLGKARAEAIRDYVAKGGRYLGLCMGAYLADNSNLGLIPQDLDSEAGRPGFEVAGIADAAVRVVWEGKADSVFYQDGPYFPKADGASPYTTIATYRNGDVAAARYTYEQGVVVLSGPHPEAGKKWFEDAGIAVSEMPRGELFGSLMRGVEEE